MPWTTTCKLLTVVTNVQSKFKDLKVGTHEGTSGKN